MRPKRLHEERQALREELGVLEWAYTDTDYLETLEWAEGRIVQAVRAHAALVWRHRCRWLLVEPAFIYIRAFIVRGLTTTGGDHG